MSDFNGCHDEDYVPGQKPRHVKGRMVPRAASKDDMDAAMDRICREIMDRNARMPRERSR